MTQTASKAQITERLAERLTAAGPDWPARVPDGATVLTVNDEWMRDAVRLGEAVVYLVEAIGEWRVQGWSTASARQRVRSIPLTQQRRGVIEPSPHDGDDAGYYPVTGVAPEPLITRTQVLDLLRALGRPLSAGTLDNYRSRPPAGWPQPARYVGRTPMWNRAAIEAYAGRRLSTT